MTIKDPKLSNRRKPFERSDTPQEPANTAPDGHLRSQMVKRSLVVGGHKTSVSLEEAFWVELRSIAHNLGIHLSQLVGSIDGERQHSNLSSAIRLFVFEYRSHNANGEPMSLAAQAVLSGAKRHTPAH